MNVITGKLKYSRMQTFGAWLNSKYLSFEQTVARSNFLNKTKHGILTDRDGEGNEYWNYKNEKKKKIEQFSTYGTSSANAVVIIS